MLFRNQACSVFSLQAADTPRGKHDYFRLLLQQTALAISPEVLAQRWDGLSLFPKGSRNTAYIQPSPLTHHHRLSRGGRGCLLSMQPPGLPANFVGCRERRKTPVAAAPQPAPPGMSAPAALRMRQRKITPGRSPRGKGLEHNKPWFQPDHPFVQETNPSHRLVENTT